MPKVWPWLLIFFGGLNEFTFASPANTEARLAIIIDDIGYNQTQSERAARLKGAFTLSVLPFTPHGLSSAKLAHNQGKELMLHLPMSTINNMPVGKGGLVSGMEKTAFLTTVRQDLDSLPHIQGVNNHMGSRLTQEAEPMQWLMSELRPRGLYFVDSRTSAQTKALDIASHFQVPSLKRDVFLDDLNETKAIQYQLNRALQFARQRGSAVAIGHPYPTTLSVLEQVQPLLSAQGVKLVFVSQLLTPATHKETPNMEQLINTGEPPYCPAPELDLLTQFRSKVDLYDKPAIMKPLGFGY
ncbi:hypothetical protein GCM10011613_36700 [Cellvibrio zantedeschiae]|uniref:Divergent polysaccharide deacetylase family protein n=1 Tax=Cellvibrio zantedeschiae TaxID=1237077 RepID=A0ABQ3BAZ5_9GAMM|nr:divergent polysaccharide deacetylase family protein [Cellvibrio zantedeschiae]GGY88313.1 hypothetical protein GCM10011613_36700 [Cellvibrio zantedeschiae]